MKSNEGNTKGIILAGGAGTRLHPLTKIISKQLLPIYDKPMIYYPLELLIDAGIKNILIITTEQDIDKFKNLLGDGKNWGVNLDYQIQKKPEGIAQALVISKEWINSSPLILILGDNLFFGEGFNQIILEALKENVGATIFCKEMPDPNRFGVIELDNQFKVLSIEEKPKNPKSNFVVTGLYIYDEFASENASTLSKSKRGEFEITDLNNIYLRDQTLNAILLDDRFEWLDTGTFDSLLEASTFVKNNK
ncbi:MAG: glucose-1-phosphate thymidylyltransferase [Euryarchaeota archaeon]|nr:glucose-1-phosphate thymidylyltransferase [Euryarchaeota archaeon]